MVLATGGGCPAWASSASDGAEIDVYDPSTAEVMTTVPSASVDDALAAVTAVFIGTIGEAGSAVHVVAGALVAFLAIFRILYLIREWDPIATKCIFKTGTMPLWYVKEHHYLWYVQLKGDPDAPDEEPEAPKTEAAAAAD